MHINVKPISRFIKEMFNSDPIVYKSKQPKPRQKPSGTPRNKINQYGDKGYVPSDGRGVGH